MSKRTNLAGMVGVFLCSAVMMAHSQTAAPAAVPREIPWSEAQKLLTKPFASQYPDEAKANHIEGTVVYKVTVRSNGQYGAMVKVSGSSLLSEACLDSIKATSFRPLQVNGHAVAFTTRVPCAFGVLAKSSSESASAQSEPPKPAVAILECTLPAAPEQAFELVTVSPNFSPQVVETVGIWTVPFSFVFHSDDPAWSHDESSYFICGSYGSGTLFTDGIPDEAARNRCDHIEQNKLYTRNQFSISRSNMTVTESTSAFGTQDVTRYSTAYPGGHAVERAAWRGVATRGGVATREGTCHPYAPKF